MPSQPKRNRKSHGPRNGLLGKRFADDSEEALTYRLNRQDSPLLRLPAEIRLTIYEYVLGGNTILVKYLPHQWKRRQKSGQKYWEHSVKGGFHSTVYDGQVNPFTIKASRSRQTQRGGFTLLGNVCRQLYEETSTLPFELNLWAFMDTYVMNRYVHKEKRLPLPQRRALKLLFVRHSRPTQSMEKFLGGLQKVFVDMDQKVLEYNLKTDKIRERTKDKMDRRLARGRT